MGILKDEDHRPKSGIGTPAEHTDEKQEDFDGDPLENDPLCQFAECHIKTTVNGKPSRIVLIVSIKAKRPVFADYLSNVTPDGKLPFVCVRPFPVRNRWYGRGYFEIYDAAQQFMERHLNYIAYRNRHHSNPLRFIKRDLIKNVAEGEDIPVSPDTAIELIKGAEAREAISFLEYPDLDSRTWELMQMMMQVVQLRSGITSAAQGGIDALPQNSTATGIEAILNSGNTLARLPIRQIRKDLEAIIMRSLKLIYANLDEVETFTYLEGENFRELKLDPARVRNLDYDVHLTMTRFRAKEQRESAAEAVQHMMAYIQLPEHEKKTLRPLFVDIVKTLGQQDAERIVRHPAPPTPPTTAPGLPPSAAPIEEAAAEQQPA